MSKSVKDGVSHNRVAIYIRVSTVHQVDKDSIPMQRNDLIAYSKLMLGTEDYVIFEDAGYSGKNTDRPEYQKMMSQIRNGAFSHLLVWKIDRISRNLLDFATMYKELKDLGVVFVSKNEQFDTSTAMGEAMLKIILVFAELERNMTSERVTATMISRASSGLWNGGRVPYGYDYDFEAKTFSVNKEESEVVHLIHDKYESMRSLISLSRHLNENDFRTRGGSLWNPASLYGILHSIFYCGDYRYNVLKEGDRQKVKDESEWITIENHHQAIITRVQKQRVLDLLAANNRSDRRKTATKYVHVFAGLLYCEHCGKLMGASPVFKKDWMYSKYSCYSSRRTTTECDSKSASDPVIGEFVFNFILGILNARKQFSEIHTPQELEAVLLSGLMFDNIDSIEDDCLNDLYNTLASVKTGCDVFGRPIKPSKHSYASELSKLRHDKQKVERASDRLTKLYLYSPDAMSESEFIIQKAKLSEQLEDINNRIGLVGTDSWERSLSDNELISKASMFILSKTMADRSYISYKRLASTVEASVLSSFVHTVIDNITIENGKVRQIIFRNGLAARFKFKQ